MTFFSFTPLVYAGLASTIVLIITGALTLKFRSTIVGRVAVVLLACAALYAFFLTLSLGTVDPGISLALLLVQLPFRLFLPVLSFLFILLYIGEIQRISLRLLVSISSIPVVILAAALTSPLHTLFASDLIPVIAGGRIIFTFTPGPVFWLQFIYSFTLITAGVTLAISRFLHSPPLYRVQIAAILAAFVLPFFIHLSLFFTPGSWIAIAFSLVAFVITAAAVYIATSRYLFLTLTPVAFPVLIDQMPDGVIIVNVSNLIVETNPAAARILGRDREALIGQPAGGLLPGMMRHDSGCGKSPPSPLTITLPLDGEPHYYDILDFPLCGPDGLPGGSILLLHDSNTRHLTEIGLLRSNEKLQLLTSITRHDILNTLTALLGSVQLARTGQLPEKTDHYLADAEKYAEVLQSQIEFTRDYQTLGLHSAQWQNVRKSLFPYLPGNGGIRVFVKPLLAEVSVFADPMFGRVFYNLIDNSLRHGGSVTGITIGGKISGEELLITYEDDGVGIPGNEKEKIFDKAYGRNTGLGLFLTREILALTGITIMETGRSGYGVRFEIHVPRAVYRIVRSDKGSGE
jgi:PAS domain-containing protein/two-component sensor histidine kinase